MPQPPPHLSTAISLVFDTPLTGLDIPALFPLIKATPNLRHFECKAFHMGDKSDPNYSNIISVPRLRSVDVTIPGFGMDFLHNFHSPLFTDVRLDGYRGVVPISAWEQDDWVIHVSRPASNLLAYLTSHSPEICRLELKYIQLEHPEGYLRILSGEALPVLEESILERSNIPGVALFQRAERNSTLKNLELHNCRYVSTEGVRMFVQPGDGRAQSFAAGRRMSGDR